MKNKRWLTICVALALAVVMIWAIPTLAQGRRGQGNQGGPGWGCGQGPGAGYGAGNCPAYQSQSQYCPRGYGNGYQAKSGRRGPRGAGRNYQTSTGTKTQPNAPTTTQ